MSNLKDSTWSVGKSWTLVFAGLFLVFISVVLFGHRLNILMLFRDNSASLGDCKISLSTAYYLDRTEKGLEVLDTKSGAIVALITRINTDPLVLVGKISKVNNKSGLLEPRNFGDKTKVYTTIAGITNRRDLLQQNRPFVLCLIDVGASDFALLVQYVGEVVELDRFLAEVLNGLEYR